MASKRRKKGALMAQENLAKLEEMLEADKDLQAKVNDLASAFEGDRADDKW